MTPAVVRGELSKLYRQRSTYAGVVVIVGLVALIAWGSHHQRARLEVSAAVPSEFVVAGKTVTALFLAHAVMGPALLVLMPLLVAVVAGGLVAGERQTGTLRTLLVRPVRRGAVLGAKLVAAWSYAVGLTLLLGLTALAVGRLVFGWGDLVILRGGLTIFDPRLGFIRLAEGYALAAAAMGVVATLALTLSTIFDNAMTAAGLAVAVLLVSGVVGGLPYFDRLQPHLLTTHLDAYRYVFDATINHAELMRSALYLAGYALALLIIALLVFDRRDVTC